MVNRGFRRPEQADTHSPYASRVRGLRIIPSSIQAGQLVRIIKYSFASETGVRIGIADVLFLI